LPKKLCEREELDDSFGLAPRFEALYLSLLSPHEEDRVLSSVVFSQRDELFNACMVDNQAIVIPNDDRRMQALTGTISNAEESIAKTDLALGIGLLTESLGQR